MMTRCLVCVRVTSIDLALCELLTFDGCCAPKNRQNETVAEKRARAVGLEKGRGGSGTGATTRWTDE